MASYIGFVNDDEEIKGALLIPIRSDRHIGQDM